MTRRTFLSAIAALAAAALLPFRAKAEPKVPKEPKGWTRTDVSYKDVWPNRLVNSGEWKVPPGCTFTMTTTVTGSGESKTYTFVADGKFRELPPPKHWTI